MTDPTRDDIPTDFLLIGGGFMGYAAEITAALTRRGRSVRWFEDRPALDTRTKAIIRLAPTLAVPKADAYFRRIIETMRGQPVRDVLVIKAEALSPGSVRSLRDAFPDAHFTLYFWDSFRNMPSDSRAKVDLFDRTFTFDPLDAQSDHRLRYRPLFYTDDYAELPPVSVDIDLLFLGTVHTDRFAVISRLASTLPPGFRFEQLLYFPSRSLYAVRRLFNASFWGTHPSQFIFTPLDKASIQQLVSRARIVLDIERTVQCGLTMRTIEMLGAGKKLITTNSQIVKADFYNPRNIAVINRKHPRVSANFLGEEYQPPSSALLRKYSLSGWLDDVLKAE